MSDILSQLTVGDDRESTSSGESSTDAGHPATIRHLEEAKEYGEGEENAGDSLIASLAQMTVAAPPMPARATPEPADATGLPGDQSATSTGAGSGAGTTVCVYADDGMSSKMKLFFEILNQELAKNPNGTPSKAVVISQWTGFLDLIQQQCVVQGRRIVRLDGKVRVDQRQQLVDEFNDGEAQIMLLSLQAGGVGLNLVGANHCFVLDLPYNPSMLDQACDRVYRVGQKRDVTVHTFVCKKSVEQWQLKMLERKRDLANIVLEQKIADRPSADDIKQLFELHY